MKFKLNVVLMLVSLTAAGVAAFYSWRLIDQTRIGELKQRVAALELLVAAKADEVQLKSKLSTDDLQGAVVAFDLNDGCPKGWSQFRQAQSRSIVGAHFANEKSQAILKGSLMTQPVAKRPFALS